MARDASRSPLPTIEELALGCVRFVDTALGIKLDFSPQTLPILDHYAQTLPDSSAEEVLELLSPCAGAYFGEVVRQTLGGRWHIADDDYSSYRIEFDRCYLHFNPMGIALEAFTLAEADEWHAHFQMLDDDRSAVSEMLERAGAVEESDYYRFSIRYEALELVLDTLSARVASRGETARRFGPEVYRAMIDGQRPRGPAN